MIIKINENSKQDLIKLWSTVFGDSEDYINLLFNNASEDSYKVFGVVKNNYIVSALYAFESCISCDNQVYTGLYIYACATYLEYRNNGLLGSLICEAKEYALNKGYDYLNLVPASDFLYEYYSRFGFKTAFYSHKFDIGLSINKLSEVSYNEYLKKREDLKIPTFYWNEMLYKYLQSVFTFTNIRCFKYDNNYFLIDINEKKIIESINISGFDENSDKIKYGMIMYISDKSNMLSDKQIYMNLALE